MLWPSTDLAYKCYCFLTIERISYDHKTLKSQRKDRFGAIPDLTDILGDSPHTKFSLFSKVNR